ncbi:MAG TPA: methylmalonyl-CoA mutase, partial [Calditrichae bacterium]|nr:methylmalonyl-CoA mutase [Calditrichia bacterium]
QLGGVVAGIQMGYFQNEIAKAAYQYQQEIDRKERIIVGVNEFVDKDEKIEIPILLIPEEVEKVQIQRVKELRETRNNAEVQRTLGELKKAAEENRNLMPYLIECAKAYCTLGEMVNTLKEVFGEYEEPVEF